MKKNEETLFAFFGTPKIAVTSLDALEERGLVPALVITRPDSQKRRSRELSPSPVKEWAQHRKVDILQPDEVAPDLITELSNTEWDAFVVVSYGTILPKELLDIPHKGTLNMHPSLLPRLRGPSPIRSAILTDEKETGVSVMLLDEKMDHGPILSQASVTVEEWPPRAALLEGILAEVGANLLAETLPLWVNGKLTPEAQDDSAATYCSRIQKGDAEISLSDDAYTNLLKIRAYEGNPGAFTYFERGGKKIRILITDAELDENDDLRLLSVIPEGKREMPYEDFLRSGANPCIT